MSNNLETIWDNCLKIIRDNVNVQSFKTWFEPIKPVKLENAVLTIQVPSQFFYEWLEEHYVTLLRKTIKRELGDEAKLEYQIIMDNGQSAKSNGNSSTISIPNYREGSNHYNEMTMSGMLSSPMVKNPFVIPGLKKINVDSQLNPNYNFDSFIEGDCNRLARSAGMAV